METKASEPLMTCRKRMDDIKTEKVSLARDEFGRNQLGRAREKLNLCAREF